MSEAVAKVVGTVEGALRYILTGFVLSGLVLSSFQQIPTAIRDLPDDPLPALFVVAMIGFAAFTVYRLVAWTLLDYAAWKLGLSVPSLQTRKGWSYAEPYARFLRWRYDPSFNERLSGYLTYRWAAVHFCMFSGIAAVVTALMSQAGSPLSRHCAVVSLAGAVLVVIGISQTCFLFRTEKALCKDVSRDA